MKTDKKRKKNPYSNTITASVKERNLMGIKGYRTKQASKLLKPTETEFKNERKMLTKTTYKK